MKGKPSKPILKGGGDSKEEKGASAEIKEETAKHASIDPSSPTSSDWNTNTGASRNMTPTMSGSRCIHLT